MALDIYWVGLLVLVPIVAIVAGYKTILSLVQGTSTEKRELDPLDDEAGRLQRTFLRVYLVVVGSEWLQNPFMYSLFRNEKMLDEGTVATLYISTYVAAAVSALFTGYLTDRFGRRNACLVFCGIHSLAAVSVCFDRLPILILGRVLGGIALTLLWTAFESWFIAEYNERGLAQSSVSLSSMFGTMTTYKCITAIVVGVLGHGVVRALGSKIHPFIFGVALDLCAAVLMVRTWNENWGTNSTTDKTVNDDKAAEAQKQIPPNEGMKSSLWDLRVWALSFVGCCFEGTVFLFLFFWPETLQDAHDREYPGQDDAIPHGVIFASFMAIMVLGALSFNLIVADPNNSYQESEKHTVGPTQLLKGALIASAVCFLAAAFVRQEIGLFISFLLLEVCNGIYVPSVAYHRGTIVTDDARARVYSLMNIPLFVFVIIALRTANGSGADSGGRGQPVFLFCAALLLVAALVTSMYLHVGSDNPEGFSEIPSQDLAGVDLNTCLGAELNPGIEDV